MLEEFIFVDCMVIDFSVAPNLSAVQVVAEYQHVSGNRVKSEFGHIKVRLENIDELQLRILPGFHNDLDFGYGYKGNEIYEFSFEPQPNDRVTVTLRSDLLSFTATCPKADLRHFQMS